METAMRDDARQIIDRSRTTYTYTDYRGRLVLERREVQVSVTPMDFSKANSTNLQPLTQFLETYYVYDNADNLRFALSPMASKSLSQTGQSWSVSDCDALAE